MRRPSQLRASLITVCLVAVCLLRLHHSFGNSPVFLHSRPTSLPSQLEERRRFWFAFLPYLLQSDPQCDPIVSPRIGDLSVVYNGSDHSVLRPDHIRLPETEVSKLRAAHARYVTYLKIENFTLPYRRGTRGIVIATGGRYLPVAVVSIRMLRATGCQLPVEVFLGSQDELDPFICDVVLPASHAHCLVLEDVFYNRDQNLTLTVEKYQYKVMAILFSSFADVLFLDSDSFPIYDPTPVFDSTPFRSTGMIRFPDFWFPSESAHFFEIAALPQPSPWASAATESGEFFQSKETHAKALLLAVYYNIFGPGCYYPLQSQGAPGEGDKETFYWSAVVFNEPLYTVRRKVDAIGYISQAGEWRGSAMVQYDPTEDYYLRTWPYHDLPSQGIRPLFLHANFPKIDPATIFDDFSFGANGPTKDTDGTPRRIWFDDEKTSVRFFGFDLERRLWEVVRDVACEYEGKFITWETRRAVCEKATDHWHAVFGLS